MKKKKGEGTRTALAVVSKILYMYISEFSIAIWALVPLLFFFFCHLTRNVGLAPAQPGGIGVHGPTASSGA